MSPAPRRAPLEPGDSHWEGGKTDRIQFTENLFRIWSDFPELRLCQLIENATQTFGSKTDLFYLGDHTLYNALYNYWLKHSKPGQRTVKRASGVESSPSTARASLRKALPDGD